ncbi:sulfite exporter TauE/SafE family protein [Novosphingobium mangrovi (ex Huang et al. 2023)]|uniref:Probable membrane transporter protein n=1 Tax=Novosphingobium mangrovi (ex Huang et al. 2023) TaxID=2976432 RepID=A0ABT2I556_9SPHN|nr:sulfite exporter TauE/SafE family protein [Novosphingobium mangrovi (ex Huang et al. 2023)]MCT2399941.1 sulfite exporter TauE/SafE family protein [Novosphingobium mangrovi (ex Huang et al. 2023)]
MVELHYLLGALSGILVGFTLGLVGGGGSILAVPLMVYFVGVKSPHIAIGTSALAVAINALAGVWNHARERNVNWRCGAAFASAGIVGALAGSSLGKAFDGEKLLFLFALLMLVVSFAMYRGRKDAGVEGVTCNRDNLPKVLSFGFGTGALSGFFGIGGGFLIVPALVASTSMPIYRAVGTSLIAVAAFGLTTAANYAWSGLIDWALAASFIGGGILGTGLGALAARRLSAAKGRLNTLFAALIACVAVYMLYRAALVFMV